MKKLTAFFKQLRLSQILTALLATVVLFVGTACNSGNTEGARSTNPPVQMGGANNPYKAGGDNNTQYRFSPKDKSDGSHSELPTVSDRLIAAGDAIQYRASDLQGIPADEQQPLPIISKQDFESPESGGQIQRESSVGDRIKDRLATVKDTFDKAGDFIEADAEEALERHEASPKPGLR